VLLAGKHTIYGVLDIPMLALEVYEETGRVVRGLGDHNHFAVPVWRDLLTRLGAVRGTRENCGRLFEASWLFVLAGSDVAPEQPVALGVLHSDPGAATRPAGPPQPQGTTMEGS
jgi:1-acyl-sn-glycerol-3-phosphate acyltransferase